MTKTGWWSVKFELTMEGEEVRWDDLDEATQEHIAECIKEGYCGGEIVVEENGEEDYNGQLIYCPECNEAIRIENNTARCRECGWFAADAELTEIMEEE